jgi:hypothetical protein
MAERMELKERRVKVVWPQDLRVSWSGYPKVCIGDSLPPRFCVEGRANA